MRKISEISIKRTLDFEGDYFNSQYDSGGATRYGITQADACAAGYTGDMREFPLDQALDIYRERYWKPLNLDGVHQSVADTVYDMAVNAGLKVAGICLQRALNLLNTVLMSDDRLAVLYPDLVDDGTIGEKTLAAVLVLEQRGDTDILVQWINHFRAQYYAECANNLDCNRDGINTQRGFVRSWTRRLK